MFTNREQPLSLRGIDRANEILAHTPPAVSGMSCETALGNPLFVADQTKHRYVTARIIDIAYQSDGITPLLDYNGKFQYQWIEEQRYIDGTGFPAWQDGDDVPMDDYRGSVDLGGGKYLHLAHEANGYTATAGDHVVMWAGVLKLSTQNQDWEHVFYRPPKVLYAKAQSDWTENTARRGDPKVSCKLCDDRAGTNERGNAFDIYIPRWGDLDPNVYGPHTADTDWPDYPGDVIQFQYDLNGDAVASAGYCGERLGSRKAILQAGPAVDESKIPYGWKLCKGFTPGDSKLGFNVPDMRGLFPRCVESAAALWGGGQLLGPGDDGVGGGNLVGVASSRQLQGLAVGNQQVVTQIENAPAYRGPQPILNNAVVCPPCYVEAFIIRVK